MTQDQLRQRLQTLEAELQKGQARLQALRQEQEQVQATMLRIEGAISVLQEMLAETHADQAVSKINHTPDATR